MATTKTSDLVELATAPDGADELIIVDKSDTTQAATGSTKKISATNLLANTAASTHTHELASLDATGITDGFVLTADGLNGAAWEALPAGGGGIGEFISTSIAISSNDTALANDDGTTNNNVGIGLNAGNDITTSNDCILIGTDAGQFITTGDWQIGIGDSACENLTNGDNNIGIGLQALRGNVAGANPTQNIGIGNNAGLNISTGAERNIMIGTNSCNAITTGDHNVAVGYRAGFSNSTGFDNTFIGADAGDTTTTASNVTCIGHDAVASSATASNEITLGDANVTTLRCAQTSITAISDARDKTNVTPLDAGLNLINELNPVRFDWAMRYDPETEEAPAKNGVEDVGFLAQELASAQEAAGVTIPKLVFDVNPDRLEATYGHLLPVMVKAIKELSAKNDALEARIAALEAI